jgi:hypothetical protein
VLLVLDAGPDPGGDGRPVPQQPSRTRHVEERLVEGDPLHERGGVPEDLEHRGADLLVAPVAAGQEHGLGAQPAGTRRRHRRADAVGTRFVRRRRHDTPVTRTTHHHGAAPQRRLVAHLDRGEEGVHVDVEDDGHASRVTVIAARSDPASR